MSAEVEGLAADERGVLLALLCGGADDAATRLAGAGADRCRAALAAVAASDAERVAARDTVAAEIAAEAPAGLERVHPGWVRRVLEGEPSAVIRAVVETLPDEVRRVGDELVRARGDAGGGGRRLAARGLPGLRRALLAALAPMPGVDGGGPPGARALCALPFAGLCDEIDRRGAWTLGVALAGAPDAVVARAAAGVGEPWARVVLEAARAGATPEARAEARAMVAAVPREEAARGAARAVGLRAVAHALAPEGAAALAAVAQRLPPVVGDALLACAERT